MKVGSSGSSSGLARTIAPGPSSALPSATSATSSGSHPPRDREAGVGEEEARETVGAVAEQGDVERLHALERRLDVEDRLDPRAYDDDRRRAERGQVGGLVVALARLAMHAAEPARGEHANPGARGDGAVAATVVARSPPSRRDGRSRTVSLATSFSAIWSSAWRSSPISSMPSTIPMVGGSRPRPGPPPRSRGRSRGCRGAAARGRHVLSSATTGRPSSSALDTSRVNRIRAHRTAPA